MRSIRTAVAIGIVALLLSARWSSADTLALQWDAPISGITTGYVLWYGTASGSYSASIDVGAVTTSAVSGLSAGTTYYSAVLPTSMRYPNTVPLGGCQVRSISS